MINIRRAQAADAQSILTIMHAAFTLYKDDLHSTYTVPGLVERIEDVQQDIIAHTVYVAETEDGIVGSIRLKQLNNELAYVYRFGVSPDINNTGIGSQLLQRVIEDCRAKNVTAIALHTNARYYKLARYYYGKQFFVHSTSTEKGYIRALFIKELTDSPYDISPAFQL